MGKNLKEDASDFLIKEVIKIVQECQENNLETIELEASELDNINKVQIEISQVCYV